MERTAAAVRVTEAIPTPVRVMGWPLILSPLFAFVADGAGQGAQFRSLVDQGLAGLGLGTGIAPLEFLAFAWVVVALIFWGRAYMHSEGLGRKSSFMFAAAVGTQAMLFLLSNRA